MINKVIKRDGRVVDFDSSKILAAVEKSMKAAGQAAPQGAAAVTEAVVRYLEAHYPDTPPKIEEIQESIEELGVPVTIRGEALTLEQFAALSNIIGRRMKQQV